MKNSNDQLKLEYLETRNVSPFVKYATIILILLFTFIPLAEFIDGLDYNYAAPQTIHTCLVGWEEVYITEPLQFKSSPIKN
jgi:hypothetical protein